MLRALLWLWLWVSPAAALVGLPASLRPAARLRVPTLSCSETAGDADTVEVWPRAVLLAVAVAYGTNFPVGRMMNEAIPAAATTSARFLLAAAALSPWLLRLPASLVRPALLCGGCDALGYIAQSIALVDTPAAKVSFLGALTVVVCPALAATLGGKDISLRAAPQIWVAAALTLAGVGLLELGGAPAGASLGAPGAGDAWALLQAVAFGTSLYLTDGMMKGEPEAALPVTACQCAVVAAVAAAWAGADGYALGPFAEGAGAGWLASGHAEWAMPGMLGGGGVVASGALWTGIVSTAAVRVGEASALTKVSASDGSVLVATEPLWAAAFATLLFGEVLGPTDVCGGLLVVAACFTSAAEPALVRRLLLPFAPPAQRRPRPTEAEAEQPRARGSE